MIHTMAIRPIRLFGDPVLRTPADAVTTVDDATRALIADMLETMDHNEGVGLAAPQIGVSQRLFVYDDHEGNRGAIINPEWTAVGTDTELDIEGCLSVPDVGGEVPRYVTVTVTGLDDHGQPIALTCSHLLARICQHETDHLDGVMFMQRMDTEGRRAAMREIRQSAWFGKPVRVGDTVFDDISHAHHAIHPSTLL